MIKILNSGVTQSLSDKTGLAFRQHAETAVQNVLMQKPGGLKGLEGELEYYSNQQELLKDFRSRHKHYVLVGIGGSSLGVQVLADVFQIKNFDFLDNVDATHFERVLQNLPGLQEVGWIFTSKSGGTIETLAALEFISQYLQDKSVPLREHCIVITEKKESDLYDWSEAHKTLFFEVPKSVGGRYSVLSCVGLVPAALMGLDLRRFQSGALKAYQDKDSLITLTAATLQSFQNQEWITVLWSYSTRLKSFGFWWQQLWAESLAKKVDRQQKSAARVSTPLPLVGATDQHSTLQQVMEGAHDKFVIFLRTEDAEKGKMTLKKSSLKETSLLQNRSLGALLKAEAEAIQQALSQVGVSNLSIQTSAIDEQMLGQLFMFFQLLVIAIAEALDINAFDQPGVELGKVMAKNILKESSKAMEAL